VREERNQIYQQIARLLVGAETHFRACIIRAVGRDATLKVVGKANDCLSWDGWTDSHPNSRESISREVIRTNRPRYWANVEEVRERLANQRWFERNNIKAYACIPLTIRNEAVGTLSVFATYPHDFSQSERGLLETVSTLIATFVESSRRMEELAEASAQAKAAAGFQAQAAGVAATRSASDEVTRYRHQLKNDLTDIVLGLEAIKSAGYKRGAVVNALLRDINARSAEVEAELKKSAVSDVRSAVDLNQVVLEVAGHTERSYEGHPIKIKSQLEANLPLLLVVQEEIRHVVLNLVQNAIRAIQKKGERNGMILISTGLTRESGIEYVELRVQDNGCGIPNENAKQIFESGFSTYPQGTGLGLYTTRSSVRRYNGRITFESKVGKGTEFIVRFPWRQLTPSSKD
jgi:signal transduction histidine kinase